MVSIDLSDEEEVRQFIANNPMAKQIFIRNLNAKLEVKTAALKQEIERSAAEEIATADKRVKAAEARAESIRNAAGWTTNELAQVLNEVRVAIAKFQAIERIPRVGPVILQIAQQGRSALTSINSLETALSMASLEKYRERPAPTTYRSLLEYMIKKALTEGNDRRLRVTMEEFARRWDMEVSRAKIDFPNKDTDVIQYHAERYHWQSYWKNQNFPGDKPPLGH